MTDLVHWQRLTDPTWWPVTRGSFTLICPDGKTRTVTSRSRPGWRCSGDRDTRRLWWHDLVDWTRVGLGPATWNWSYRPRCSYRAPDGRQCAMPWGHISYLYLPHRTSSRRRFIVRMASAWPSEVAA